MADEAQALYDTLADGFLDKPGVIIEPVFHNECLKVNGKVFAMLVRWQLVVKLPAKQVLAMIAAGEAVAFEPRAGRPMKEWAMVGAPSPSDGDACWRQLMIEAHTYVSELTR
ncbi:MAG: hypothetical protein ACRDFX_00920 [Chloroflexota bacterium]